MAHHPRSLARHRVVTDPAHVLARAHLRDARRELARGMEPDVEVRDLGADDRFFELRREPRRQAVS